MRVALLICTLALMTSSCNHADDSAPRGTPKPDQAAHGPSTSKEPAQVVFETPSGLHRITVEVVSTGGAIQRGLMYRHHLAPDHGMLFVFATEQVRTFWMKNTLVPLDMIFVGTDGKVEGVVANTEPLTLTPRTVGTPSQYVIEVNAGWTGKHGVAAGTPTRFENLPEIHNPPP